jgi:hypothetical protein
VGTRIRGVRVGTAGALGWEDHIKGQACLVCKRNSLLPEPPYALPPCCPEAEVISPSHTSSSAGPFKRTTPASHRSAGGAPVAPAGGGACAASTAPAGRRCRAPARSGVRAASRASAPSPARSDAPARAVRLLRKRSTGNSGGSSPIRGRVSQHGSSVSSGLPAAVPERAEGATSAKRSAAA